MAEQLLLCGLSRSQRAHYAGGHELNLHGPGKNVRLDLDDVRVHY